MAMHAAKNVMCHKNMKQTAMPLYLQKICTDGNGLIIPIQNEMTSVNDVIVIETAASDIVIPIRSGTLNLTDVRRQAANITNVSSIPIPIINMKFKLLLFPFKQMFEFGISFLVTLTNHQERSRKI